MKTNEKICTIDNIDCYCFYPSLFQQYDDCYKSEDRPEYFNRIVHKIRMAILKIQGNYRVYYFYGDGNILGHIVVSNGGNRIKISTNNDIVLGPIWICPSKRGSGLGTKAINIVLNNLEKDYQVAYEYIEKDNIASIRAAEKNRYRLVGSAKEYGLLKKIKLNPKGNLLVYKYEKD